MVLLEVVEGVVDHECEGVGGVEKGRGESLVYHRAWCHNLLDLAITHTWRVFIEILVLIVIVEIHIFPPAL